MASARGLALPESFSSRSSKPVMGCPSAFAAAKHAAQHTAQNLAAQRGAHGAYSRFGHGLCQAIALAAARAGGAEQDIVQSAQQAAAVVARCLCRALAVGACLCRHLIGTALELFVGRF